MKRKIIGVTVGSPLPKPNLKQTDPKRGDYVHGRDIIPTKVSQLENDAKYATEEQISSLSAEKLDKDAVFGWAKAEQFDIANLANCNLEAREGYARYMDNSAYFVYTMPNPQPGAVTVTLRYERDEAYKDKGVSIQFKYSDGSTINNKDLVQSVVHTLVSDASKTLVAVTGNWNIEQFVYLDLSVMSMIADYAAPSGGGEVSDEQIRDAVEDYLTEHPVEGGGSEEVLELIISGEVAEGAGWNVAVSKDENGNALSLKKALFVIRGGFNNPTSVIRAYINEVSDGIEIGPTANTNTTILQAEIGKPFTIEVYDSNRELHKKFCSVSVENDVSKLPYKTYSEITKVGFQKWNGNATVSDGAIYALYGVRL